MFSISIKSVVTLANLWESKRLLWFLRLPSAPAHVQDHVYTETTEIHICKVEWVFLVDFTGKYSVQCFKYSLFKVLDNLSFVDRFLLKKELSFLMSNGVELTFCLRFETACSRKFQLRNMNLLRTITLTFSRKFNRSTFSCFY